MFLGSQVGGSGRGGREEEGGVGWRSPFVKSTAHRQDRLQYTAPQLVRSIIVPTLSDAEDHWYGNTTRGSVLLGVQAPPSQLDAAPAPPNFWDPKHVYSV